MMKEKAREVISEILRVWKYMEDANNERGVFVWREQYYGARRLYEELFNEKVYNRRFVAYYEPIVEVVEDD